MRHFNSYNSGFGSGTIVMVVIAVAILAASTVPAAGQIHGWSFGFGGVEPEYVRGTATDAYGNVYVTGSFQGTVDFGGGPLNSQGSTDIYLVKYDLGGNHLWSKSIGNSGADAGTGVDTDAAGNVYLTGAFHRTVDFGGGGIANGGWGSGWDTNDIFVAKYDSGGNHLWSYGYGGIPDETSAELSVNDAGDVAITGTTGSPGFWDGFVTVYDASGTQQWSQGFGGTGDDKGIGVHIDDTGNVVVTGSFEETVNFGGGNLTASGEFGHPDIFLAKYNAAGAHQWSQRFGWVMPDEGTAVSVDNAGNVAVTGYFESQANFGDPAWIFGFGYKDIFIAMYDAGGTYLWAQAFGNTGGDMGFSVDFDNAGNVIATGHFRVSADFGGGTFTSAGYTDIFLASYDATGSHLWSRRFGDAGYEYGNVVCAGGPGELWLTGNFTQTIDFGGGTLTAVGSYDGFVARFGMPQPAAGIVGVNDVPDDEGLQVTIDFIRSSHDDKLRPRPIVSYEVYRWVGKMQPPVLVGAIAANQRNIYSIVVPTLLDNKSTSYMIHAATAFTEFFNSPYASGYSVDNLAPAPPQNFVGVPPYLLTWDPAPEPDFDYFTLYGSQYATLDGNAVLIGTTTNTSYDVQAYPHEYYHLMATDDAGNESDPVNTSIVVGVGDVPARGQLDLQAHPNPFNPATTIRYEVPQSGIVSVSVYEVSGRLVETLVESEYRKAGGHEIEYHPAVASGVYFLRLVHGGTSTTSRIVLLK